MNTDVIGPAIEVLEQRLTLVDYERAQLSTAIATMRRLIGHPHPEDGLPALPLVQPASDAPLARIPTSRRLPALTEPVRGRQVRRDDDVNAQLVAERDGKVLAAIQSGITRRYEIVTATGLPTPTVERSLAELIRAGRVVATGKTSARRFSLPGAPTPKLGPAVDGVSARVLKAIADGATTRDDIWQRVRGLTDRQWRLVITGLLATGDITRTGNRAGVRYALASRTSGAAASSAKEAQSRGRR